MKLTKLERAILLALKTRGNEAVGRGDLISMAQRLFPGKNVIDCTLAEDAIRELKRRGLVSSSCGNTFIELTPEGYWAATVELTGGCWRCCNLVAEHGTTALRQDAEKKFCPWTFASIVANIGVIVFFVSLAVIAVSYAKEVFCRVW